MLLPYYEIPDTNNSIQKTTFHALTQSRHCGAIVNPTTCALATHSALFLPPDVEQMSKRANDS